MTHLHSIIKNALLPVCLETTAKARQEEEKSVEIDALVDPVMTELQKFMRSDFVTDISDDYIKFVCQSLAIITRKPYLANAWKEDEVKKQVYPPLTVIMPAEGSKFVEVNVEGMIVIHGGNLHGLSQRGEVVFFNKLPDYIARLATDEEVEHFLDSLNSTGIRAILKNDLFAPMIEAMTQETELVVEKGEGQTTVLSEDEDEDEDNIP